MAPSIVSTKESWSESAAGLLQTAFQGPTTTLNKILLQKANAISPFSSATAILDNGCGVGQVLGRVIEEFGQDLNENTRLVAADLSEGMIRVVMQRKDEEISRGNKLWQKVETEVLNAENLASVPNETFSHITAGLLFFMVQNPQSALKEARRVLEPNGLLVLSSFRQVQWMDFIEKYLAIVKPGTSLGAIPSDWASTEAIKNQLDKAGFREELAEEVQVWYEFDDAESMTRFNMKNIPSVKMATSGMKESEVEEAIQLMVSELHTRFPSGRGKLGGTALVGFAKK
ncbi:S-adenosyl-L-methionine-dependent methyltransferase [Lentithecium fluviatile CBS 122367]|uniref:S-adenosyl-L-methionine-dependent methyltransferase n=1 Tax=Lentithecium fluviatile CBS 122367 TaxID=1168545 RepID=A0A6G1JKA9_9PLEO|nr:S-adenosyl-L-methionine-dependent methyltransferase [Lentithecium fluviatile CBS 122367]